MPITGASGIPFGAIGEPFINLGNGVIAAAGAGSPEGRYAGDIGSRYFDTVTGAEWIKFTSSSVKTGWRRLDFGSTTAPFPGLMGPVFNVLAFAGGVTINTGVNDATAAIIAAETVRATVNGTLVFPDGTYVLSTFTANTDSSDSAFKINAAGRWVGLGTVWLKYSRASGLGEIVRVNSNPAAGPISDVVIENIGFDGNAFQCKQGVGIRLMNTHKAQVRNCRFKGFGWFSSTQFSYAIRNEGYGTPVNPHVWAATLPTGYSRGTRIVDCVFDDAQSGGGAGSPNAIFNYQVDGALIRGNVVRNYGLGVMTFGPNRRVSIVHNEIEDGYDNGIRFEQDSLTPSADLQRNRDHTVSDNVIRNMIGDGIRLNGYGITCKGNTCSYNTLSGIASNHSENLNIEGNECHFNGNRGIYLDRASISGQVSHAHPTIVNNDCNNNAGHGIQVRGGATDGVTPATAAVIRGNRCRFNSFDGIDLRDADSKSSVTLNVCEQNGNSSTSFAAGIHIVADVLSWGGATIALNRCFDNTASPNAKQPIGIWLGPLTAGKTLNKCYCYFNDCSDAQNSAFWFGSAIATNYGIVGVNDPHFLYGNLYRNTTRGLTEAFFGLNIRSTDILVQEDEDGDFWRPTTGGYRQTIDGWTQDNVVASQTNVELVRGTGRFRAARAGSVTAVIVTATEARTAGTLTVTVFKNTGLAGAAGATIGLTAVLDGTNTSRKATTQAKDTDTFAAGDELYVVVTTDAGWLPVTSDIRCAIEIED